MSQTKTPGHFLYNEYGIMKKIGNMIIWNKESQEDWLTGISCYE